LIALGNGQGNLTAARANLLNFIGRLEQLAASGNVNPAVAAPLLQGARDILEQIEGNQPVRGSKNLPDDGDPNDPDSIP